MSYFTGEPNRRLVVRPVGQIFVQTAGKCQWSLRCYLPLVCPLEAPTLALGILFFCSSLSTGRWRCDSTCSRARDCYRGLGTGAGRSRRVFLGLLGVRGWSGVVSPGGTAGEGKGLPWSVDPPVRPWACPSWGRSWGVAAARWAAEHSPRRRDRRAAAKKSAAVAGQLAEAEQRWRAYVGPEAARLEAAIEEGRRAVEELVASYERQMAQSRPLLERRQMLLRSSEQLAVGLGRYRDHVDGGDSRTARPVPPTSSGRSKCRPLVISRQSTALGPNL